MQPLHESGSIKLSKKTAGGRFVISLDFELAWGVRDQPFRDHYRSNLLGARAAIPAILALFRRYEIHATWAIVGMLFHRTRAELVANAPAQMPEYADERLRPQID